ncbi:MAG: hydantoinase B/oxoprolinase family protein [SAR324 cluster bacterium]|nr:hydantoinase B/oxoprolinase family protein [SAR324 cluster bacterium]
MKVAGSDNHKGVIFDPIDLEVLWNRLITLVDEAAYAIVRTSMSKVVVEGRDFGMLLLDSDGRLVATDVSIASKVGTNSIAVKELLKIFPLNDLKPGDVLITNNPWWIMGHLNDIAVVAPLFYKGRLVGFTESMAHMADIGGSLSGSPRELYEEGLIVPPLKAVEGGRENTTFFAMLEANVRVPEQVSSDVRALITGLRVMQVKLTDFLQEHDLTDLDSLSLAIRENSEGAMRRGITENIPDGVYHGKSSVDGLDEPLHIQVCLTVKNGEVDISFDGSSPQSSFGVNSTLVYTHVWSVYILKCVACPTIPNNEGTFAPISVRAPEGCFLNPLFPAPVKMKPSSGHYIPNAILDALKDVVPKRILADSGNKSLLYMAGRHRDGRPFSDLTFVMGGMGARAEKDGLHAMSFPANSSNIPVEVLETVIPIRLRRKHLRPDSGGAGKWRGGCGQVFEFESVSSQPITVRAEHGKLKSPPLGLRGGLPGAPGGHYLNGDPIPDKLPVVMQPGDIMRLEIPGSGGAYPPGERDPAKIQRDVDDELVSLQSARRDYGPAAANLVKGTHGRR